MYYRNNALRYITVQVYVLRKVLIRLAVVKPISILHPYPRVPFINQFAG